MHRFKNLLKISLFFCGLTGSGLNSANAQKNTSLADCLNLAKENNLSLRQAKSALLSGEYNVQAEKKSYLPKIDLLSSYTYLSNPLTVNLQTVKSGIVEGSSAQTVNAANQVFKEITGTDLAQTVQQQIYSTSKNIISTLYPDYNPPLSRQSYFVAGLGIRQPLFLGNKLDAAGNLAQSVVTSAGINVEVVNKETEFLIALQYLRILYLNTVLIKQQQMIDALSKNRQYAQEMVKNQILPPYQVSWTNVVLTQFQSQFNNLRLEKENAHIELNKVMGIALDSNIIITDTLKYSPVPPTPVTTDFWLANPLYRLAGSKIAYAKTAEKISKSFALPNIFAVGNYNFYQKDLPVLTPDWFVGVELQWTLFNGQTHKRTLAARQLIEESKLAEQNAALGLQVESKVARNKVTSLQNDVVTLNEAKNEAKRTSRLITERMKNQLSSPKDVNDALLIEMEIEKAYSTAVFGYYSALAAYFNSLGNPKQILQYIN